jgi:drug/metabolite transporter (DMT)-like permease
MRSNASPAAVWAGMVVLWIVWGTTYLGIALVVDTIPPFLMAATRFGLAGLILGLVALIRERGALVRPTARQVRDMFIVGAGLVAVGNAFVGVGEQTIPSGIAAVMVALMPAWVAFFSRVLFRDRLPKAALAGIVIGVAGVAILAWPAGGTGGDLDPRGLAALVFAPIGWSLGSLYAARKATPVKPSLLGSSLQMLGGAAIAAVLSIVSGELARFEPAGVSPTSIGAFFYLTLVGSLVGYSTYGWLIMVAPLTRVSTYTYVNPIVAVFLGSVLLSEPITPRTVVAAAVIIVAVALVVTARGRMPGPPRREPATEPLAGPPVAASGEPALSPRPGPSARPAAPSSSS